jgi:hypothetical protein
MSKPRRTTIALATLLAVVSIPGSTPASFAQAIPMGEPPQVVMLARPCASGCLNPVEAVTLASQLGDRGGLAGQFQLTVRGVGAQNGFVYLNSEADYRDRNCLTLAMPAGIALAAFGTADPEQIKAQLLDRQIVATGVARRVRIDFLVEGQPTGKYYYQVHVRIGQRQQLLVLPSAP